MIKAARESDIVNKVTLLSGGVLVLGNRIIHLATAMHMQSRGNGIVATI